MIRIAQNNTYYINERALSFYENDKGNPNRISVAVSMGAVILVYDPKEGISFGTNGEYQKWKLSGYDTLLVNNNHKYVYARLSRNDSSSLIVFDDKKRAVSGAVQTVSTDEEGNTVTVEGEPSDEYYFIQIGELTKTDGSTDRQMTYDSGLLSTPQGIIEADTKLDEMFELDKETTPWLIRVKQFFESLTIQKSLTILGNLIFGDTPISGIHTSTDLSDTDHTPDDEHLATSGYVYKHSLSKNKPDRTPYLLSSDTGFEAGEFAQGSEGAAVYRDEEGNWHVESDYVDVRMKFTARDVEIQKVYHIAGAQIKSSANMKCVRVEELESAYRCYMNLVDGDGNVVTNDWRVKDQAYVQTFNLRKQADGTMGNHFLWRLVTAVGDDYIDLSKEVAAEGSDAPMAGDDIVQLGYRGTDDSNRRVAVVDAGAGTGAPYYRQYTGIESFHLPEPDTQLKPGDNQLSGVLHIKQGSTGAANLADLPDFVLKAQQMGAVNLLRNSGFTGDYQTEELSKKGRLTGETVMYSKPLEYWTGTATATADSLSASGVSVAIGSLYQDVKLTEGEVYAVSYKAKGESITVSCGEYTHTDALGADYQRYRHSFTFTGMRGITFEGDATVCEIQLERGSIATDWHPSPLDVDKSAAGFQSLQYIADAIKNGSVDLLGGLVLASMIQLGNYSEGVMKRVTAGVSGIYNDDDDVYTWGGGTYEEAIRAVMMFKKDPTYQPTEAELKGIAKAVITHGGRAILNDVVLRGYIYALGGLFKGAVSIAGGKILLNEDGSGRLADGTIRWDTYGNLYQKSRPIIVWRDMQQEMDERCVTGRYAIDLHQGTYLDLTSLSVDDRKVILPMASTVQGLVVTVRHRTLTRMGGTYAVGSEDGGLKVFNETSKSYQTAEYVDFTSMEGYMPQYTIESNQVDGVWSWYVGHEFTIS